MVDAYLCFRVVSPFDFWFGSKINVNSPFKTEIIFRTFRALKKDPTNSARLDPFSIIEYVEYCILLKM